MTSTKGKIILQFIILVILRVLLLIGKTWTCYYVYFGSSSIRCLLVLLEKSFFILCVGTGTAECWCWCWCVVDLQKTPQLCMALIANANTGEWKCVYMHIRYK